MLALTADCGAEGTAQILSTLLSWKPPPLDHTGFDHGGGYDIQFVCSDLTDPAVARRVRRVARAALADHDRLRQRLDAHVDELCAAPARGTASAAAGIRKAT